jgi:FkbM family methyltransferase
MNLSLVKKYFNPTTILDIGGHIGEFFNLAKQTFPESTVFIIEGNKDCEPYLKTLNTRYLIRLLGKVRLLGKENKAMTFYKTTIDPICTGNSIYREVTPHFDNEFLIEEQVQLHTIDSTFQEVTNFDLIKIDTQGSELDILAGGSKIAKKAKGIILEVSFIKYNHGSPLYSDVVKFMDDFGFIEREYLDQNCWYRDGLSFLQRDILFVNKNEFQ